MLRRFTIVAYLAFAASIVSGCGNGADMQSTPHGTAVIRRSAKTPSPIQHVVLIIQENRSFNDFFATFPGADGTTTGQVMANTKCQPAIRAGFIKLTEMPLVVPSDLNHLWMDGYQIAYDNGKLDAFDDVRYALTTSSPDECTYPYQYTDPADIKPYWAMASQYTLAEHMFTTQGSASFTAHQDLIRGGTIVASNEAMVDFPSCGLCFWGCDAPKGTSTRLVTASNTILFSGPFPCSNKFSAKYRTLRDLLDRKKISWKYYVPTSTSVNGKLFSAFDVVYAVRHSHEWKTNISTPETNILKDIANGNLAAMSWVVPEENNSDHPGDSVDNGPEWVSSVVNAVGESRYWNSTAIVIVWDDWGGLYDNEAGVLGQYAGPGERVPAIVISPYALAGHISTTTYQFGSILKYIENNWHLGSLGTTDKTSTSIIDCFNYNQTPLQFQPISSSLGPSYFLHEKHSYRPPDDDW